MTDDGNATFATTRDRSGFGSDWRPAEEPPQTVFGPSAWDGRSTFPPLGADWPVPGVPPRQK